MALWYDNRCWCNISRRLRFSKHVITKPGDNLHPQTAQKSKVLQRRIKFLPSSAQITLWHDFIKNSLTHPPSDPRTLLTANELVTEVLQLQRVVRTVYCVRRGAPDILKEMKATGLLYCNVKDLLDSLYCNVKDLLSNEKPKTEESWEIIANLI